MRVLHSSLRPFVNSSPTLFPESDRRLGVIVRMEPASHNVVIVESESPSFVSTTHGERIENETEPGTLDRLAVDGVVRTHLVNLAHQCEKIAEELTSHAARFHKLASQKALLVDETGVESGNESSSSSARGEWNGGNSSAVVPAGSIAPASTHQTMRPLPPPIDLEDI